MKCCVTPKMDACCYNGKKIQIFMENNTNDIGQIDKKEWCSLAMCCYLSILKTLNKINNDF